MKRIISIGVVLALLVTFVVPVAVGAEDRCEYGPPGCAPPPDKMTQTLAGVVGWSMLGAMDAMGVAVGQTTGALVCGLGGVSDELGVWGVDAMGVLLDGVAGLLPAVGEMLEMEDLIDPIADMLAGLAGLFRA